MPKIISLPQHKVFQELKYYDFGFILRENHVINKVSSPIKLLEYTSSGVIPILTDSVGDYPMIMKDQKIGIVIDDLNFSFLKNDFLDILNDSNIYLRLFKFSENFTWSKIFDKNNEDPLINFYE